MENMETPRSPLLMNRNDTSLLIVDVQKKLLPHIAENEALVWNLGRLVQGAALLEIPIHVTEQYPKGLGATIDEIKSALPADTKYHEKRMFSARECSALWEDLKSANTKNVLLVGIETHVCVLQTAMDLMSSGFNVFVCIDAVGSRFEEDFMTAMQRMETSGAVLVSTEMALFEWCESADSPVFKKISRIVQEEFEGATEAKD